MVEEGKFRVFGPPAVFGPLFVFGPPAVFGPLLYFGPPFGVLAEPNGPSAKRKTTWKKVSVYRKMSGE